MTQELHEQPGGVAARTAQFRERLFRRLHARFEPDGVFNVLPQPLVDGDDEIVRGLFFAFRQFQPLLLGLSFNSADQVTAQHIEIPHEIGREPAFALERREFVIERRIVSKGKLLRVRFKEKIERVQHRHFRDQIHFDEEFAGGLLENQARLIVGLRVLRPVDEMFFRFDPERVAQNPRARMRRRPQPDDLRAERNQPVVSVMRFVMERDVDGHGNF